MDIKKTCVNCEETFSLWTGKDFLEDSELCSKCNKLLMNKAILGDQEAIKSIINDKSFGIINYSSGKVSSKLIFDKKAILLRFSARGVDYESRKNNRSRNKLFIEQLYGDALYVFYMVCDETELLKEWIDLFWVEGYTTFGNDNDIQRSKCILSIEATRKDINKLNRPNIKIINLPKIMNVRINFDGDFNVYQTISHFDRYKDENNYLQANTDIPSVLDADKINIENMTWEEFEILIKILFEKQNFIVSSTSRTNDGGIDLIANKDDLIFQGKYIIQCKKYSGNNKVGVRDVRDLYGVVNAERAIKGIIITTTDFTEEAIKFANGKQIDLINRSKLMNLIQNNI